MMNKIETNVIMLSHTTTLLYLKCNLSINVGYRETDSLHNGASPIPTISELWLDKSHTLRFWFPSVTVNPWRPLLPHGYSYSASSTRSG